MAMYSRCEGVEYVVSVGVQSRPQARRRMTSHSVSTWAVDSVREGVDRKLPGAMDSNKQNRRCTNAIGK
jgi:hypothetical protein